MTNEEWQKAAAEAEKLEKKTGGKLPKAPTEEPPTAKSEAKEEAEQPAEPPEEEAAEAAEKPAADEEPEGEDKPEPEESEETVFNRERIKFRQEKREFKRRLQAELDAANAKLNDREAELTRRFQPYESVHRAIEAGDVDGMAKSLGFKDWTDLQTQAMQTIANPNYKRLRSVENELEKVRQEKVAEQERRQVEQQQAAQQKAIADHKIGLTKALKAVDDPLAVEFAADSAFVDLVFEEQRKDWVEAGEELSAEEAATRVLERIAAQHATLAGRFGKAGNHAIVKKFLGRRQSENDESSHRELENLESRGRERENHGKPKPKPSHSRTSEAGYSRERSEAEQRRAAIEALKNSTPG